METRYLTKQIPSKWPFSHGVVVRNPGTLIILAGRVAMERFTNPLPTLTLIGVKALAFPELLIEIRAVAALPDRPSATRGKPAPKKAVKKRRR